MKIDGLTSTNAAMAVKTAQTQADGDFAAKLENATKSAEQSKQDAKLKKVCQDMEAVFLNMMYSEMRNSVPKSSLMGENSSGEQIMRSMLDSEMTKNMAKAGGIGLADMLYRQLSKDNASAQLKTAHKGQAPQ